VAVPWYKRPKFWEWLERFGALGALASGVLAVWDKLFGAVWGSACGAVLLVAKYAKDRLDKAARADRDAYVKRAIGAVLNALSEEYFSKVDAGERHNHRATLFFVTTGNHGTTKQLHIYQRAGVFKASTTAFAVNEDEEQLCEGVAGRSWFCSAARTVELPDWTDAEADQQEYAAKGFLTLPQAAVLNVKSKVVSGIVVRVGGNRWGVLVVDSKTRGVVTKRKEVLLARYAKLVGNLLEEAQ
jgi:hypothetical protein